MSLKVAYVIFYVAFLSIFVSITGLIGISVLSIESNTLASLPQAPPDLNIFSALTFLFEVGVFGVQAFGILATVSTEFLFLSIAIIIPFSLGMLWAILELARGN